MHFPLWFGLAALGSLSTTRGSVVNDVSSARQRAQALLDQMTWREKIGQMGGIRRLLPSGVELNETYFDAIYETQNGNIGYGNAFNWAQDILPVVNNVRRRQINDSRLHIPFITLTDSINGIYPSGGTIFPGNLAMAASFNLPLFEQAIAAIREEHLAIGTTWLLSPPLDVATEPRYSRIGENFGEDQYLVGEFGKTYVRTMEEEDPDGFVKVATTVKHFVYGECSGGVNLASQWGGINHLYNDQMQPYIKVISQAEPLALMVSYSTVDRVPMHKNKYMLQDILRQKLGFAGVIMSDAHGINQLHTQSKTALTLQDAAVQALNAGIEMELCPSSSLDECGTPALFDLVEDDVDLQQLVDDAVVAILTIKFRTGLFDKPLPDPDKLNRTLRTDQHLRIARQVADESIVLLQNDGLLPHTPSRAAVIGPFADIINAGSYATVNSSDSRYGRSFYKSMISAFGDDNVSYTRGCDFVETNDTSGISEAVQAAKDAGFAVLMLGSLSVPAADPLFTKRTDGEWFTHADLGFPGLQQDLLDAVLDTGVPTVLILSGGQPFVLSDSSLRANAIIHSFLAGEFTGEALVDIITGKVNPSAKLTVSLPQHSSAIPINYNYLPSDQYDQFGLEAEGLSYVWQFPNLTRDVPMPFGFGLSYTTFSFANLTVASEDGSSVAIEVTLENTGEVFGKEVVQVYYRPVYTDIEVPVKSLVGFVKVGLDAGESRAVHLDIPRTELGHWVNGELTSPAGPYTFWVGSSARWQDLTAVNTTLPRW